MDTYRKKLDIFYKQNSIALKIVLVSFQSVKNIIKIQFGCFN